jgi:hypothetical protein
MIVVHVPPRQLCMKRVRQVRPESATEEGYTLVLHTVAVHEGDVGKCCCNLGTHVMTHVNGVWRRIAPFLCRRLVIELVIAGNNKHALPVTAAVRHEIAVLWQVRAADVASESQNGCHGFEDGLKRPTTELQMEVRGILDTKCSCTETVHRSSDATCSIIPSLFAKHMPLP